MAYWIIKSEPNAYSFEDMLQDKKTFWDGVRNFQARKNLREMKVGDQAFFYHSNEGKEVVGLVRIVKEAYQDPTTKDDWSVVDVAAIKKLPRSVTLEQMKADKVLKNISLVKQSRLSVCPLSEVEYKRVLELADL